MVRQEPPTDRTARQRGNLRRWAGLALLALFVTVASLGAIYFFILLVHRSIRDDHMCQQKYGDDWETYKKLVPYRFVPGLF